MDVPSTSAPTTCQEVSEVLSRVGDKWTIQVVLALRDQPRRFNDIRRQVDGISHQMLARTLRTLERDGIVVRKVFATAPPQVEYTLTLLGASLFEAVRHLAEWARAHHASLRVNRSRFDEAR